MIFSIVVPVYRVEKYLGQCIESVLSQSFRDYELILIDDGSPDKSSKICDEFALMDSRINVLHKSNGGLSDARNAGLDIATGDYILFLDSDDWWDTSDFLQKLNARIKETNADVIIYGMKKFYSKTKKMGEEHIPKRVATTRKLVQAKSHQCYMTNNYFVACACDKAVKRSVIEENSQRFVKGQLSEDIEWCAKLLQKDLTIDVLEESAYVYRKQVETSISMNIKPRNIECILDVIKRYANDNASFELRHFLANQYVLLITNFMRLTASERKPLEKEIKSYWWLLNYNWYPYVKKIGIVKPLGFTVTKKLLRLYYLFLR